MANVQMPRTVGARRRSRVGLSTPFYTDLKASKKHLKASKILVQSELYLTKQLKTFRLFPKPVGKFTIY